MRITDVTDFAVEGWLREGLAVDETARPGHAPGETSSHRWGFPEIVTAEGSTGLVIGGGPDLKAAGPIERGSPTAIQADPVRAGGITEIPKVVAVASTDGVAVVPSGNKACRNAPRLRVAKPERTCSLAEWGVRANHDLQQIDADFHEPRGGDLDPPAGPGFGDPLVLTTIVRTREDRAPEGRGRGR